ncbi:Imm49 family immunity protein [Acetonema longum]|uniref:Uncharacterized protein n=1 Tax=Acetonema longum DSM 6540 TaxID=1009370 RepID=F7NN82_9FIRM|nr:Imm49 family immunity protein [Acetonema longum]EGO62499.1 hypothetical protein ALO_17835 [Acetonema longum DSM 6540]
MSRNSYLSAFPEIFQERKESVDTTVNKLKTGNVKNNFIDRHYSSLAYGYSTIGMGEWLLHSDAITAKKNFYLSAKLQEILFQKYDDKKIAVSPSFVVMSSYPRVLLALISDSYQLTDSLARLIGNRPKEERETGHPFADNVGYAIKHLLLNEDAKAKTHIDALLSMENDEELKLQIGYGKVLKGILDADENAVNEGLKVMTDCHKKDDEYKDSPEEFFSIPVLGLAKLAMRRGIKISIDDPIAPKEMLEHHEIEYPAIDFVAN